MRNITHRKFGSFSHNLSGSLRGGIFLAIALLPLTGSAQTQQEFLRQIWFQTDPDLNSDLLEEAITLHQEGVEGDKDAVLASIELLEEHLKLQPKDWLARAMLGSAFTLRARDAPLRERLDWLKRGGASIDRAAEEDPENPRVILVRAMNSYNLPTLFGRAKLADQDFTLLLEWIDERPSRIDPASQRFILFHFGKFRLKQYQVDEALDYLRRAIRTPGKFPSNAEIQSKITELTGPPRLPTWSNRPNF